MEFLVIFAILFVAVNAFFKGITSKNPDQNLSEQVEPDEEAKYVPIQRQKYVQKERLMNKSERQFFLILQKNIGNKYLLFSKVRIEDFIRVNEESFSWGEIQGLRGRIKSKHVDFLICDIETTKPLMAVELDGKSHRSQNRRERDEFINSLYEEIGLPIEHISVGSNFFQEALKIKNLLLRTKD